MVALLLFSFGTLGIARLQLGAAQATRDASDAAVALMLAEDLAQRVLLGERLQPDEPPQPGDSQEPEAALWEQSGLPGARACVARGDSMWRLAVLWEARAVPGAAAGSEVAAPAGSGCAPSDGSAALRSVRLLLPREVSL
jgi:Tfp pilus assembly protein PilV